MEDIFAQYKPKMTPATPIPPIITSVNIDLSNGKTQTIFEVKLSSKSKNKAIRMLLKPPNNVFLAIIFLKEPYSLNVSVPLKTLKNNVLHLNKTVTILFLIFQYIFLFITLTIFSQNISMNIIPYISNSVQATYSFQKFIFLLYRANFL